MGFFELLDYACASLAEAGYRDPWDWTPRQIFHRLDVHNRLAANRRLVDLQTGLLASRGDKKHLEKYVADQRKIAATQTESSSDNALDKRHRPPADDAQAARSEAALKAVGWSR